MAAAKEPYYVMPLVPGALGTTGERASRPPPAARRARASERSNARRPSRGALPLRARQTASSRKMLSPPHPTKPPAPPPPFTSGTSMACNHRTHLCRDEFTGNTMVQVGACFRWSPGGGVATDS